MFISWALEIYIINLNYTISFKIMLCTVRIILLSYAIIRVWLLTSYTEMHNL